MERSADAPRYEVDETGKVTFVVESPQKMNLSPSRLGLDNIDVSVASPAANELMDQPEAHDFSEHAGSSDFVSIAEPLKLHGNAFNKFSSQNASTPVTHLRTPDAEAFPSSPQPSAQEGAHHVSPSKKPRVSNLHAFLCTVPHLCTLSIEHLLALRIMVREYDALDNVIETGTTLQHAYVLASGTVEVFDLRKRAVGHKRVACITAPNIFGLESLIFDRPSEFSYSSSSQDTTILLISKAQFLELFSKSNTFAHSVGSRISMHMPQFNVFQDFCRAVFAMSSVVAEEAAFAKCEGYALHIPAILDTYSRIGTVIHPHLHKIEIDVGALHYACARLPANITETFVINLARSLPPFLASELRNQSSHDSPAAGNWSFGHDGTGHYGNVTYVTTSNRRRSAWRIGDKGHTLILMRDGLTDLIDFVTSFCIHVIEARKLRIRLQSMISPSAADVLKDAIVAIKENSISLDELSDLQKHVLGQLPLTPTERIGLNTMWPHSAIQKLYNIIMHQEQYIVKVDTSLSKRFMPDAYFQWALKIRREIFKALGLTDMDTLPSNVDIVILSSRNRSTKNLLCSLVASHKDAIKEYDDITSTATDPPLKFENEWDRYYYFLFRMINDDDNLRVLYTNTLKRCGFSMFEDYTSSGLQLDLIDVERLDPECVDPYLKDFVAGCKQGQEKAKKRKFIVNIDYTFGAQAEGIMRSMFLTFGQAIRSVNIVGKCAGIAGNRGDILLPRKLIFSKAAFGEDTTDEIRDCGNQDLTAECIQALIGDSRRVLTGPCITIPGMILQNEDLIKFYKLVYGAAGMEMEGSYIARQIDECANLGLIRKDINTRFIFYMSDMPIGNEDGAKFNPRLKSAETITTMYASLRVTLRAILARE